MAKIDRSPKKRTRRSKDSKPTKESANKNPPLESLTDPHRLAEIFLRRNGLEHFDEELRFWRDQCWAWNGRRYSVLPPADLRARITDSIRRTFEADRERTGTGEAAESKYQGRVTRGLVSDVLQALQSLRHLPSSTEQPTWLGRSADRPREGLIAVENGLLDVGALLRQETNALRPLSKDWFSPISLSYRYDPDATCQRWLAFLNETLEGDAERIALVQEWFGYCLIHDTSRQKFLIVVGEGADGKTVLILVLIALVGSDNVSHVPLELFGQRFQLTTSLGKLLNAVTEIGELDKVAEGLLKAFVSGDPMFFDRKNLPAINARPTARCVFTTNTLPHFKDRSSGVWRRMLLLPFQKSVPLDRQDPHLVDTLTAELSGIFNWAIEGLRRLRCQGRFTEPTLSRDALDTYRTESNPARAFLLECVVASKNGLVESGALYGRYRAWIDEHGYRALDEARFGHELRRIFPMVERKRITNLITNQRPWAYAGVDLA